MQKNELNSYFFLWITIFLGFFRNRGARIYSINAVQPHLFLLGYLDGYADGVFGEMTAAAVELFNAANGVGYSDLAWIDTLTLLYDGDPYIYEDSGISIYINEDATTEWEALDDDKLRIRFPVTSRAKKKNISEFEIYVYATGLYGELVFDNVYRYQTTKTTLKPGESTYSDYIVLPERSRIYAIRFGIHKVKYQDGTSYSVPNYYAYSASYNYRKVQGEGDIKPFF